MFDGRENKPNPIFSSSSSSGTAIKSHDRIVVPSTLYKLNTDFGDRLVVKSVLTVYD